MARHPTTIDSYLSDLRAQLPGDDRWREAILAEVEDHLRSTAAELGARVGSEQAEREAIERFGTVESIAGQLVAEYGVRVTRRTVGVLAVALAVYLVFSLKSNSGPFLTGHLGALLPTLAAFVLTQVAWTTLALTGLRALLTGHRVRASATDFRLLVRGGKIAIGSLAAGLLLRVAVLGPTGASLQEVVFWLAMAATLALAGLAVAWSSSRLGSVGTLLEVAGPEDSASEVHDLDTDVQALAVILRRSSPLLRPLSPLLAGLARTLSVRRHSWRLATLVSILAGLWAFKVGAMSDGLWPAMANTGYMGQLIAGATCAAVEAVAVLAAYFLLGRYLALKPPIHGRSERDS